MEEFQQLHSQLKPKVVRVFGKGKSDEKGTYECAGSGFFVKNGLILICEHVTKVCNQEINVECWDGQQYRVEMVRNDVRKDLALLQVLQDRNGGVINEYGHVDFAEEDSIRVGMEVVSLQHSHGIKYTFAVGYIASPCDELSGRTWKSVDAGLSNPDRNSSLNEIYEDNNLRLVQVQNLHGGSRPLEVRFLVEMGEWWE